MCLILHCHRSLHVPMGTNISLIRESVDSLCRDGANMTCPHDMPTFPYKMAQNSQTWQLQDTYTHSMGAFVPLKYIKYTATMTYRNWPNRTFVHFLLLLLQLNLATAKVPQVLSMVLHKTAPFCCVRDP